MKLYELISEYCYAQLTNAENEVSELQRRVRFRRVDTNDSVELMCALVRLETLQQVFKDITTFISMRTRLKKAVSFVINPNN